MVFIFDIDGTLTNVETGLIVPSALEALQKLQENGHQVFIASGRAYYKTKKFTDSIGINNFIANGGNSLCLNGTCIYNHPLDHDLCIELLEELERLHYGYLLALDDSINAYMKDTLFLDQVGERQEPTNYIYDPALDYHECRNIYKIYISIYEQEQYKLTTLPKLTYLRFSGKYLTIQPDNKRNGIYNLLKEINETIDHVVVFGDDTNDIDMFQEKWFKIAMGNAHPDLKQYADFITKNNTDDGILYVCKYFHWIK